MHSGGTRRARIVARPKMFMAMLAAPVLVVIVAACGPEVATQDTFGLTAASGGGQIVLTWNVQPDAAYGYDVQYAGPDVADWTDLPSVTGTTAVFDLGADKSVYWFRVRTAAGGAQLWGEWGAGVSAVMYRPSLPVVTIETAERAPIVGTDTYVPGELDLGPNGAASPAYRGSMQVKGRGNTTANQPKRPFKVKLDSKASLLGMPSNKEWVLLANAFDLSQLRTYAATGLGQATGLAWTPDVRFVELVLNGSYEGVYILTEQVEIKGNKIDIDELEETDIAGESVTGGYLLEINQRYQLEGDPGFVTSHQVPVGIKDPEPPTSEQTEYITSYVREFESALFGPQFTNPTSGYRPYVDLDSFVDYYLVQELAGNVDAYTYSTYFYKPRGGALQAGPLWDFDRSFSTRWNPSVPSTGWAVRSSSPWITRMLEDPAFRQRLVERWDSAVAGFSAVPDAVTAAGTHISAATHRNDVRWRSTPDSVDEPEFIATWLTERIAWMDSQFHATAGG